MIASLVKPPDQPKILIKPGPIEIVIDLLGVAMVVLLWMYTILQYDQLPGQVVTHLNAKGVADHFGEKTQIFFLPGLTSLLYVGLWMLNRYPHIFNYLVKITPENAARQYLLATRFMRFINISVLVLFSGIQVQFIALSKTISVETVTSPGLIWMVGLHLAVTFFGMLYYVIVSSNAK
jgi:uncharacterized membrane protein